MNAGGIQIDADGRLNHFLSIEGLPRALLLDLLAAAESFAGVGERPVKKVPLLRGKTIANLFFGPHGRMLARFPA